MTNYDIEYFCAAFDVAIKSMQRAIDYLDGTIIDIDCTETNIPTIDKAILKSILSNVNNAQDLLMDYVTELKARKS